MLINNLEQLSECKDYKNLVGNDGITFYIFEGKNKPCEYWSPNKESKKGKLIAEILNSLKTTFEDNSYAQNFITNSKKYIDKDYLEIKNENPLYIKLFALETSNCEKLKSIVDKLPNADEIYIDITEFEGEKNVCFLDELNKKYKSLRWIQNQMFDKFNAIPKSEK